MTKSSQELSLVIVKRMLEASKLRFDSIVVNDNGSTVAQVSRDGVGLRLTVEVKPELVFTHTLRITKVDDVAELAACLMQSLLQNDVARIRATLA